MAESPVTFLVDKLAAFFGNEVNLFRGAPEEVVSLKGDLEQMKAFLRIADALQESDEELSVWVRQVRDIAYETEDLTDEYTLLQGHNHGPGLYGSLCRLACCIKNAKACYRIAAELKNINSRLQKINEVHKRLRHKFRRLQQGSGSAGALNTWQDYRDDALLLDKSDLVGIDERKKQLIEWLITGSSARVVVSLAGQVGVGKTTLAKQVYDDDDVKKNFKARAWITVSQSFEIQDILKDMVQQLFKAVRRRVPPSVENMNNSQLKTTIKELLQRRRYLIVLDDVAQLHAWRAVQYALPNNSFGSRVMLTTRNTDVASTAGMESEGKTYFLEPLPLEESWELFSRKTFQGTACPPHLEEICKYVLKKCQGLPLAIVAISGVLATKDTRRIDEWDMVARSLGAEIDGNDKLKDLKLVLSLSFNDLPYYLKSCFLYLSIFPEDHLIERMKVIRLWVAEEFVQAKEGKVLEEVAVLKVLDLQNSHLKKFPVQVVNLFFLKYLSLRGTKVKIIPQCIGTLQNLQTLDLKHSQVTELPVEILKLQQLRHLLLYQNEFIYGELFDSKSGFKIMGNIGVLQSLQKLSFIEANHGGDIVKDVGNLTQLRRLGILKLRREDGTVLCSSTQKLTNLRALSIASVEDEIIDLEQLSSPPVLLQRLYMRGRLEMLPHWIPSLQSLVKLSLKWSRLKDDPLVHLQYIPNPVHLILCRVFTGDKLHFQAGGFKKLKILGLDYFEELRCIQLEPGALKFLENLSIRQCQFLEKVPSGIENLTKLKSLEFFEMSAELFNTLRPDIKDSDYWRVAHIPEVYSTYWREGEWKVYSLESLSEGENCPLPSTLIKTRDLHTHWK